MNAQGPPGAGAAAEEPAPALSAHERALLSGIEDDLRSADPALAAALAGRRGPPAGPVLARALRHVLLLVVALTGLAAAAALLHDRLGVAGVAGLTAVAVVPWLVHAARAVGRVPDPTPSRALTRVLLVALAVALLVAVALSPTVRALLGILAVFMVLPWLLSQAFGCVERRLTRR